MKCESHPAASLGYCDRRARWMLHGVFYCGTHKRELEARTPVPLAWERWPKSRAD
jgi:hypothetical protein